ncbi:putative transmembrane efflux protein [Candidatus Phaeomarinobacter ectocarpi]|uniref:Putative transmembrane efflux protein n=1 Tax=Candidatus Phaeomarinibacter ectocarpi TaxID=1458461 RepID=X5ME20_9HYPH|nr:MFS transporter [Candidatus Phaeomarinobacter ectocarpi]CDO58989.1 putative transmembrane efflux protein [Candidatus Phaeomarinobacter ectocarpi]
MPTALAPPCDESIAKPDKVTPCVNETGTLVATILASSLAFVEGSIVNIALPSMLNDLGVGATGAQWIINSYLLPVGALVLMGGALGDHYGRKLIFQVGLFLFAVGSLACALAPEISTLLVARIVQGIGAALLAPNSLAIIAAAFKGAARGRAIGIWAAAGAFAGAAAPILGGWIVDVADWRWAFLIVVPGAAAAIAIGQWAISESCETSDAAAPLDWSGAALVTLALAMIVWALVRLPEAGISDVLVAGPLGVGVLCFVAFIGVEKRLGDRAMMPLQLFGTPDFSAISVLTLFLYGALGGLLVLLPYTLITGFGFTAIETGLAMLPMPLILGFLSPVLGGLAGRLGVRLVLTVGPLLVAVGFFWLSFVPADVFSYWTDMLPPLVIMAVGTAASVAPLTTAVMDAVPGDFAGVASGVNNAVARSAGLIATALIGPVLAAGDAGLASLVEGFGTAMFVAALFAAAGGGVAAVFVRIEADASD